MNLDNDSILTDFLGMLGNLGTKISPNPRGKFFPSTVEHFFRGGNGSLFASERKLYRLMAAMADWN